MDVCSKYPKFYHIGLPKTGTTTLQTILRRDPRVHCIGSRYFNTHQWWTEDYEGETDEGNIIDIVSEENIVLQSGNFGKLINTLYRIQKIRPDAHIILTVREQRNLLCSRYKFNIPQVVGFSESFEDWLKSGQGMDYLSLCLYENLFRTINLYFPEEQIHFLLFEDLEICSEIFFNTFYSILGLDVPDCRSRVKENVSLTDSELYIIKQFNRLKLFRGSSFLSRMEAKMFRCMAKPFKNKKRKMDCFKWGTSLLFKNIEKDFAETNRKLVARGIFSRNKLAGSGYLL